MTTIFCSALAVACSPNAGHRDLEKYTVSAEALIADDGSSLPPTVAALILWPERYPGARIRNASPPGGGSVAIRCDKVMLTLYSVLLVVAVVDEIVVDPSSSSLRPTVALVLVLAVATDSIVRDNLPYAVVALPR